ncbi:hypothetical protein GS539_28180 [Rhodococcus hoagii]|nr:hypothetical protein [Prescottella equi]
MVDPALVAVEHTMIIAAWNMLTNGEYYRDLGADYLTTMTRPGPRRVHSVNSKHSDIK